MSVGSVCLGAAALTWWRGHATIGLVLGVTGALLVGFGALAPSVLGGPNRAWWRFAQALGWINARLLLTLFFAVVLTPVGIAMRLFFGRNPLGTAGPSTNWRPYTARRRDCRHYERMF